MASSGKTLIFIMAFVITIIQGITCKPAKRSATDCYGTDCVIDPDELDFNGNPRDTELLENITSSVIHALPGIAALLKNIAYVHQNTTATALPSIVQTLEDEKNLQVSQNLLIENGTSVLLEMVRLMQNQQSMQERHYQWMQDQEALKERLMQDQAARQSRLLENVTASLKQSFLPLLTNMLQIHQDSHLPQSCSYSYLTSGQHKILPQNTALGSFPVVCDMDTDGGRWIVFQRRFDGSVDFDRVWNDYENGFGSINGEFWLGLNKLHIITSRGRWELRVDLEDFDGNKAYASYDYFHIGDSASFYRLDIGSYSGTAGDSMRSHDLNGMAFTTKDQDHDHYSSVNCGIRHRSGWWHKACTHANPNGLYLGRTGNSYTGMIWYYWKGHNNQALKKSELKIRLIEGQL